MVNFFSKKNLLKSFILGDCVDGVCECDTNYYGEDCSIFYAEFIGDTASSYASIGMAPIPMILLLFIIFLTV